MAPRRDVNHVSVVDIVMPLFSIISYKRRLIRGHLHVRARARDASFMHRGASTFQVLFSYLIDLLASLGSVHASTI